MVLHRGFMMHELTHLLSLALYLNLSLSLSPFLFSACVHSGIFIIFYVKHLRRYRLPRVYAYLHTLYTHKHYSLSRVIKPNRQDEKPESKHLRYGGHIHTCLVRTANM